MLKKRNPRFPAQENEGFLLESLCGTAWQRSCIETFEKCHFEERERREILRSLIAFGTWISPFGRNDKNGGYSKLSHQVKNPGE